MGRRHGRRACRKEGTGPEGYDATSKKWRGINANGTIDEAMLEEVTATIAATVQPQKIILFGSAARGTMNQDSDIDLLIIKDEDHHTTTASAIHMHLPARARRVDVVVASTEDIKRHQEKPYYVFKPALREGRMLYDADA